MSNVSIEKIVTSGPKIAVWRLQDVDIDSISPSRHRSGPKFAIQASISSRIRHVSIEKGDFLGLDTGYNPQEDRKEASQTGNESISPTFWA